MSEAVTLKVDINVYQETLTKLGNVLADLEKKKEQLQTNVEKLGTDAFRGSDVNSAIDLANKQMTYVQNAINKVQSQRDAIEKNLQERETHSSTLQSDVSNVDEALPDIFANS